LNDTAPKFIHDCTICKFLGRFNEHDLYVCMPKKGGRGSLIARFSSEGSEYSSVPFFPGDDISHVLVLLPEIGEAYKRASQQGLI
jgi:hypothetical protein